MTPSERAALTAWIQDKLKATVLSVHDLTRHAEGFSWETYTFTAEWRSDQQATRHGFALRREPAEGLLPPYDARRDHQLHRAVLDRSSVPVPGLHWLETDRRVLGRPFYVMDQVSGIVPVPWKPNDPRVFPDEEARARLGRHFVDVLADIHAIDLGSTERRPRSPRAGISLPSGAPGHTGADVVPPAITEILSDSGADTDDLARGEVARWADVVERSAMVREPLLDAAVLWLEGNVATSGRRALVHGDYRIGNVMVGDDGLINAVFDWELAHIGDPVFDLAWASLKLYGGRSGLMSRLLPIAEGLRRYTDRTGLEVDPAVFRFWTVFCHLRALAPYLQATQAFQSGRTHDTRLANMGHQSGHLMKFLAEELGLRATPSARSGTPDTSDPDGEDAEGDATMMQNTPERLLRGAAEAVRDVLAQVTDPDPFVRSQLRATAELLDNLAPRIEWSAADLTTLIARVRTVLEEASAASQGRVPRAAAVLATPVDDTSVATLIAQRDAHLEALRDVQAWLADTPAHPDLQIAVEQLLAWQIETDLAALRAGSAA
ncbi:phosphotransferase family protein [Euzebya tangerina]|uniref:phosphotransferase family protein n=1 Tax=Euzebya tangerina TaxID=591198 RepID=UPI0013C2F594|nr:phosphotransferase family protein [Euzebya tangerina]